MSEFTLTELAEMIVPMVVVLGAFSMVVLLVWFGHRSRERESGNRAETQKRFLDKFGSGSELADFLGTDNGQRFLDQLGQHRIRRSAFLDRFLDPRARAVRMIVPGIVLTLVGLAMLVLTAAGEELLAPGVIILAVGTGILISSAVMRRVSKEWDTSEDERPTEAEQLP